MLFDYRIILYAGKCIYKYYCMIKFCMYRCRGGVGGAGSFMIVCGIHVLLNQFTLQAYENMKAEIDFQQFPQVTCFRIIFWGIVYATSKNAK